MIPIIVSTAPVYVDAFLVEDLSNRSGRLPEVTAADVYERLNDQYTAEITVPRMALNASGLQRGGLIRMKANPYHDAQLFRVNRVKRQLVNGDIVLSLNHISYDLNKLPTEVFTATGITEVVQTFNGLAGNVTYNPFRMTTTLTNETSRLTVEIPTPWRSVIGGSEGSILDVFGGQLEWDNLSVKVLQNRGQKRNVAIRYGVNLIEFTQEENISNTYSGAVGYVAKGDDAAVVGSVVYDGEGINYPLLKVVDLSNKVDDSTTVTKALVTELTEEWIAANHPATPQIGMTVDFARLAESAQYQLLADLEDIRLGDTVDVIIPEMSISQEATVTGMHFDPIREKITSVELGSYRPRLSQTISGISKTTQSSALRAYPLGAVYQTYNSVNPAAILGGRWTLLSNTGGLYSWRRIA